MSSEKSIPTLTVVPVLANSCSSGRMLPQTICSTAIHQYLHNPAQIVATQPNPPITCNTNCVRIHRDISFFLQKSTLHEKYSSVFTQAGTSCCYPTHPSHAILLLTVLEFIEILVCSKSYFAWKLFISITQPGTNCCYPTHPSHAILTVLEFIEILVF